MKESERRAEIFLRHQGYEDILHHPRGQHGKLDFLIDHRIAVEVTRLNRNYERKKGLVGFEGEIISLRNRLRKIALSFGPPVRGQSWLLTLTFRRPGPQWRSVRRQIRQALQGFVDRSHSETQIPLGSGLVIELFPMSIPCETFFVPGPADDGPDGSYWLMPELERNLRLRIAEKITTTADIRSFYEEWWLVLDDYVGCGMDAVDRAQFRETVTLPDHPFDRIILISPLDPRNAFQIAPECGSL